MASGQWGQAAALALSFNAASACARRRPPCFVVRCRLWRELPLGPLVPVLRAVARGTLKTAPQGAATQVCDRDARAALGLHHPLLTP